MQYDAVPQLTSGIEALNSAVNERLMAPYLRSDAAVSVNPLHVWTEIAGFVWAAGCAALLLYALVRLVQTKRRVCEAALLGDNVWLCDAVASPFILGVLRPRVYLPSGLDGTAQDYVLAHERAHRAGPRGACARRVVSADRSGGVSGKRLTHGAQYGILL